MHKFMLLVLLIVFMNGCASNTSMVMPTEQQREGLLRERIAENWNAMIAGDRLKVYAMYDPFFRTNVDLQFWRGISAPGKYYTFNIKGLDIRGNVAYAEVEVEYSYSLIGKFGQKIERERTKVTINETWLYVDDNWWRQFRDGITDGTYAHY